jgi:hypothetical protein
MTKPRFRDARTDTVVLAAPHGRLRAHRCEAVR